MSGYKHRHRLRHMANPHCWFRRPSSSTDEQQASPTRGLPADVQDLPPGTGLGVPVPQSMIRDELQQEQRRREEEEEYNMALALSLSADEVDRSSLIELQERAQLAKATQDSMSPAASSGAAESLSWSLFTENSLDWDQSVVDGLYDVWGQFPEILEIAPESGISKLFPSLDELRRIPFTPGDSREVVVVDHANDSGLCTIDSLAADAVSNAIKFGAEACVLALVNIVVEQMGGSASAGELAQRCWDHMQQLKYRRRSLVLPIGEVKVGLARHRALLFKSLADACRLPCKVVRGERLGEGATGDRAAVLVRLGERLISVDLFSAKLRLIGASHDDKDIAAKLSAPDGGLDWHGELDGPALLPLAGAGSKSRSEGRPDSGQSKDGTLDAAARKLAPHRSTSQASSASQNARLQNDPVAVSQDRPSSGDYPSVNYVREREMFAPSPDTPSPFLGGSTAGEGLPATSSIFERIATQPGQASSPRQTGRQISPVLEQPPAQPVTEFPEAAASPFQNIMFQVQPSLEEEELGGSYEFIGGRVAVTPATSKSSTQHSQHSRGLPEPTSQNANRLASRSLPPQDSEELEGKPSTSQASGGTPQQGDKGGRPDEKGHWKLRALANIRRHSDTDIFVSSANRKARDQLAERLEALPEVTEAWPDESPNAGNSSSESPQVPKAEPSLAATRQIAAADPGSSGSPEVAVPDEWEIKPEELKLGPRIGIGSFGEVFRGSWRYTDVAVKKLIDQELSGRMLEEFKSETAIMKRLRHVNILLFLGAVSIPGHLAIVTQYMPRGSLFRILHRSPNLVVDEKRRMRMAVDIARGMNYLHSCEPPIVHRDLKSPNLLVDKDFTVKVCDFGLSRVRMSTLLSGKSQAGTPEWTAPEVLRSQAYDESSDCYSYGVILWELLTSKEPWHEKTAMQVVGAVGWGNARLQIPEGTHADLSSLILRCWSEPKKRPTFGEVLQYLKPLSEDIFVKPPGLEDEQSVEGRSASEAETD